MTKSQQDELREKHKRHVAIEHFMLTHPKVELGVQPYTYSMPFNTMYEVMDEYVAQQLERAYLSRFSYMDWEVGDDDQLRVGDYINCNHQRPHDGYEQNFEGKIVSHHTNGVPVVIYNVDVDDPDNSGEYADLQSLMMDGWEFSRIATLQSALEKEKE